MAQAKVQRRIKETADALAIGAERMRKQNRAREAAKYRQSSNRLQRRLQDSPESVKQEYTRTCPWCPRPLEPYILDCRAIHPSAPVPLALIIPERCGCRGEAEALVLEAERRRMADRAFDTYNWSAKLARAGLVGWLADATFDTFFTRPDAHQAGEYKEAAKRYCDALLGSGLGARPWLVMWGPYGTGKSHLAAAILHEAMAEGWKGCYFRAWTHYQRRLRNSFDRKADEERTGDIVAELQNGRLVVIDDIDKQHPTKTGWAEEELFTVLNERYNGLRATILTFNRPPEQMLPWLGAALVDRIRDRAFEVVEFAGPSYRSEIDWQRVEGARA